MGKSSLLLVTLIVFSATRVCAGDSLSDAQIKQELVGSWIDPPNSTDYNPASPYSLETFKPDGTYTYVEYGDASCHAIVNRAEVKWRIENGVLLTILSDRSQLRDEVLSIENGIMTLRSLEDGTTYTREKALTCSKAVGA